MFLQTEGKKNHEGKQPVFTSAVYRLDDHKTQEKGGYYKGCDYQFSWCIYWMLEILGSFGT